MGVPYWHNARDVVQRSLVAPRSEDGAIERHWWETARQRYQGGLYFCPILVDLLHGRWGDINKRASELARQGKLDPEWVPKVETTKLAIECKQAVSLQFLVKLFDAVTKIAESGGINTRDYAHVADAMKKEVIVPSFFTVNWERFDGAFGTNGSMEEKLAELSKNLLSHTSDIDDARKRVVLPSLRKGYNIGTGSRIGTLTITDSLATSLKAGMKRLNSKLDPGDVVFMSSIDYNTRALTSFEGNVVTV